MEFLPSFPRLHFAGKQVVASLNVGCFLKLKSIFIQSVLGVNRKYYGQRQNSESAILRLRLGRFVPNCIMGLFWCSKIAPILASNMEHGLLLLPSCAGHWDKLRLRKQNKKGRTHYIFLIKILLMD